MSEPSILEITLATRMTNADLQEIWEARLCLEILLLLKGFRKNHRKLTTMLTCCEGLMDIVDTKCQLKRKCESLPPVGL